MRWSIFLLLVVLWISVCAKNVEARVDRVEVLSQSDVLEGTAFGDAGSYSKLIGTVHFKVKPDSAHNRVIVDLDKAKRDDNGEVSFAGHRSG